VPAGQTRRVFLRALVAFLALPGVVAFAIPLFAFRRDRSLSEFTATGAAVLAIGIVILGWCVRDFYVLGKGTLAPWDPPKKLVVRGLYRYSRNPMYVGVLFIVAGWALGFRSGNIAVYAAVLALGFHLRVLLNEEPFLARTHGADWDAYRQRVPRWLI
jgi:protein-S-isoprenylcysteine O-methyltransferase Ste14